VIKDSWLTNKLSYLSLALSIPVNSFLLTESSLYYLSISLLKNKYTA